MSNSQIYIFIVSTISTVTIGIIGFWLKNFITGVKEDFRIMLSKYETLSGSVGLMMTDLEKLSGKFEYMEKRIEKDSDSVLKFNHDVAVLTERIANIQKHIDKF
jgi:ribosomal protein S15P/S13E